MTVKIGITIQESDLQEIDKLVEAKAFPNRSKAIQEAISDKLSRVRKTRLARECKKLDPNEEKRIAEECFVGEAQLWEEEW